MSGSDEADQEKGFLARWSQRKQEAQRPEREPAEGVQQEASAERQGAPEPEFDLSELPKLEELTGSTDITAFLKKGVPEHLRNAALRKSWALDPAIRNYVSPALDYAYDWNAPGGVPGGGQLETGIDVAKMVSQIMGDPLSEGVKSKTNRVDRVDAGDESDGSIGLNPKSELAVQPLRQSVPEPEMPVNSMPEISAEESPMDQGKSAGAGAAQQPVRRHGTAKPTV
jgi:hypothetical protein